MRALGILLWLGLAAGCSEVSDKVPSDPFNIEVRPVGFTPSSLQQDAIDGAVGRWEAIIVEGLPDRMLYITQESIDAEPLAEHCQPVLEYVDDMIVFLMHDPSLSSLAVGKLCTQGGDGHGLATTAVVRLSDSAFSEDIEYRRLEDIITHEIGHALVYTPRAFNMDQDDDGVADLSLVPGYEEACPVGEQVYYQGEYGVAAWHEMGGEGGVPLRTASDANDHAGCTHLDGWVFTDFLMRDRIADDFMPISSITVGMLKDVGYGVDLGAAETYVWPGSAQDTGAAGR